MTATELILRDPLGERALSAADFPVSLGGPGHTVVLPGAGAAPLAWIALHDGQLFLQPAANAAEPPLHNGAPVTQPTWLHPGDVIDAARGRLRIAARDGVRTIDVEDGSGGNLTVPPEVPLVETVRGGDADADERIETVAFRRAATTPARRKPSARRIVPAVLLLLVATIAWFLFTGRAVTIATVPEGSKVAVTGGLALHVGGTVYARPGQYRLEISHPGYETLRTPVAIGGTQDQFRYQLQKLPGRLLVRSPVAARVAADGRDLGSAPGEFKLSAGRHELTITAPKYQPYSGPVDVVGLDQRQTFVPKLVPSWALVTVLTEPTGAAVFVDGQAQGAAPAKLELDAGTHRIELRHPGFKDWVTDVQVAANVPQTLGPVKLGLPDGTLVVRTNPAGASVTVGGAFRGHAPLTLDVRPDVPLEIVATRDGYEPATGRTTIASGARSEVQLALKAIFGDVTVNSEPAGAEVLADGRVVGRAGQPLKLPAAKQTLQVRLPGFRSVRKEVTPRPGLPQVLEVRLEPGSDAAVASAGASSTPGATTETEGSAAPAAAATATLATTARTKGGAELKLLGPVTYTMGSPRRESGRRANESQRPIELHRRFYLATREITNGEYKQFKPDHRSGYVGQSTLELQRQPVVGVSWEAAAEYCNWLSQQEGLPPAYQAQGGRLVPVQPMTTGYRLPTEAEWEWAARGSRDGTLRKYPWGDTLPIPAGAGNFGDRQAQPLLQTFLDNLDDGNAVTANVGSYAPNAFGFYDLGGNVAEWTTDLYVVQPPVSAVATDPLAAGAGNLHVIRGSSWRHATVTELRAAYRDYGDRGRDDLGFRIARYAE